MHRMEGEDGMGLFAEGRMGWKREKRREERGEGKFIGNRVCLESQACFLNCVC